MYRAGQWKAVCDRCGFEFMNVQLSLEWTGYRVCRKCLDHRHPQELIQAREDRQAPPWVRPVPVDIDLSWLLTEDDETIDTETDEPITE